MVSYQNRNRAKLLHISIHITYVGDEPFSIYDVTNIPKFGEGLLNKVPVESPTSFIAG